MKTYDVTIRATVTKTLRIEAENEDEAVEYAYQEFNCSCDGLEAYGEDMLDVKELT